MALTPKNSSVDVYSLREIAQAAGVPVPRVEALIAEGKVTLIALGLGAGFFSPDQAIAAVRTLHADGGRSAAMLFDTQPEFVHASPRLPIAVSSAIHAGIAATVILISTIGLPQAAENERVRLEPVTTRLVFIASPGPGGGGGGLRQKAPPPPALRKGKSSLSSPVPVRKAPKPVEAAPRPEPPPPPPVVKPEPLPPVVAPVAAVAALIVRAAASSRPACSEK